jgi:hypothetical protein
MTLETVQADGFPVLSVRQALAAIGYQAADVKS